MSKKYVGYVIESEAGWGSKVDETKEFDTKEAREQWVKDYNDKYNPDMGKPGASVPNWYMVARAAEDSFWR